VKRYRVTVDGRTYEVEIDDPRARPVTARVLGEVFRVDVEAEGRSATGETVAPATSALAAPAAPSAAPAAAAPAARQQQLTAPIPGKITKVTATAGQAVQRGDELVTIEAMKMFNIIRSPWAGTVVAVHTAEGKHVTQGELLLTFTLS
jgi:biotin carboxyl carrier protein